MASNEEQKHSAMFGGPGYGNTLDECSLAAVADYIKSGQAKNIVIMTGAGISTAAGIPDFRSPGTGLYAKMKALNLPYPEAVTSIDYFRKDPVPFYIRAQAIFPGQFKPTFAHYFIKQVYEQGLLLRLFTQNIDTLESMTGVDPDRIVEAHGSFANQHCIDCHAEYPHDKMRAAIENKEIPTCENCNGYVKPDIVFFGEPLPERFWNNMRLVEHADLCIVIGTSLTVSPFSMLPQLIPRHVPRVLFNNEVVGGFGERANDVMYIGACDNGAYKLAEALGWVEEIEKDYGRKFVFDGSNDHGEGRPPTPPREPTPPPGPLDITEAHASVVGRLANMIIGKQQAERGFVTEIEDDNAGEAAEQRAHPT